MNKQTRRFIFGLLGTVFFINTTAKDFCEMRFNYYEYSIWNIFATIVSLIGLLLFAHKLIKSMD